MGTTRIKVIDLSQEQRPKDLKRKKLKIKGHPVVEQEDEKVKEKLAAKAVDEVKVQEKLEEEKETVQEEKVIKKKAKFAQIRGKRYQSAKSLIDSQRTYPIDEAIDLVKKTSYGKFDGSVEVHIIVASKDIRGTVTLPHSFGKKRNILVFTPKPNGLEKDLSAEARAKEDGILIGDDQTLKDIEEGKLIPQKDFQEVVATPDFMPKLTKIAKILGPKGLMPNPKLGTVTDDPQKVVEKLAAGLIALKTEEKAPIIHTAIGKVSLEEKKLKENLLVILEAIGPQKIKKLVLSPTMGPGIKVDLSSINF